MSLPEKMKAVVNYGPEDFRVEVVNCPKPKALELVVKVEASGICGSDVHCYSGAKMHWGGDDPYVKVPVIPGHEFIARVVELGEGAEEHFGVSVGDRVIAEQIVPCNKCRFCKSGQYWMCETHDILGFQKDRTEGSWAEYMLFRKNTIVHKVPDSISLEDAAFIEPMACALHVAQRAQVDFADVVVIAGAGPLGLAITQAIKLKTPKELIVVDIENKPLELAKKLGASMVINASKESVVKKVKSLTSGYGCDVYIEATGHPTGVTQGLDMIRRLGRFIQFSVLSADVTTDFSVIGDRKELDLLGSHLGPYCYPTAIDLFSRKLITADGIVTHTFKLDEFEKALEVARSKDSIKVLLVP